MADNKKGSIIAIKTECFIVISFKKYKIFTILEQK
jgi:hypothetical protein